MKKILLISVLTVLTIGVSYWTYDQYKKHQAPSWESREALVKKLDHELKELADQVKSLQGTSHCVSDTECKVVGLGSGTCQGYKDFLIYSTDGIDEGALLAAVRAFNQKAKQLTDLQLTVNSCGVQPAKIKCINQRCEPDLQPAP